MKKNYVILFLTLLSYPFCFSQTKADTVAVTQNPILGKPSDSISGKSTVFEKIPIPKKLKVNPEVFYIVNDKPVDYKTYINTISKPKDQK